MPSSWGSTWAEQQQQEQQCAMMQARAAASFERGPPRLMDNSLLRPRSIFPFPIALHTQPADNFASLQCIFSPGGWDGMKPSIILPPQYRCQCLSTCNCICSHLWSAEYLMERCEENLWAMIFVFVFYIFFVSVFVIVFAFIFAGGWSVIQLLPAVSVFVLVFSLSLSMQMSLYLSL